MPGIRTNASGLPSRPGLATSDQEPEPLVGPEHVGLGDLRLNDRAPHPHEVGDPLRMRRQLEVSENQHASQAVADPVDAVVSGLALHVVEDGRHVVLDQVVDRPAPLASFSQEGLAKGLIDPVAPPHLGVLTRAPNVEDVDLVSTRGQLRGEMVVGDRPEGGIESQAVTENHRQLVRIGMFGPVMANAQPPAVLSVGVTVGARPQIRARRIAAHGGATRHQTTSPCKTNRRRIASARDGAYRLDSLPTSFDMPGASLLHGAEDSIEPAFSWELQQNGIPRSGGRMESGITSGRIEKRPTADLRIAQPTGKPRFLDLRSGRPARPDQHFRIRVCRVTSKNVWHYMALIGTFWEGLQCQLVPVGAAIAQCKSLISRILNPMVSACVRYPSADESGRMGAPH